MTLRSLANLRLSESKATVDAHRVCIITHCCTLYECDEGEVHTCVGFCVVLFLTDGAMRDARSVGWSNRYSTHTFFVSCTDPKNERLLRGCGKAEKKNGMKQNVFMTSMYFLIPLRCLSDIAVKKYMQQFRNMPLPHYVKGKEPRCLYAEVPFKNNENVFYYSYDISNGTQTQKRQVVLRAVLIKYLPGKGVRLPFYMLAIGTEIDMMFEPETVCTGNGQLKNYLCTERDLVKLKKAFCESDMDGLYYPSTDPFRFFDSWLKQLVENLEGHKREGCISLEYSAIDVLGIGVHHRACTKGRLNAAFSRLYYARHKPKVGQALVGNYERFAYGLLFANDNYCDVPCHELKSVLGSGYSNCVSEVTYAAGNSILFLHTHHPYSYDKMMARTIKKMAHGVHQVQNIGELCDVVYCKHRMQELRELMQSDDAGQIKHSLLKVTDYMQRDLFCLAELDKRTDSIFRSLGLNEDFETLFNMAQLASDAADIRLTQKTNTVLILLSVATLTLGVFSLLPKVFTFTHIPGMKNYLSCSPSTGSDCILQIDLTTLIFVVLCLIFVALVILIVQNYRKRHDENIRRVFKEMKYEDL